ncbi:MAG: hypothetical protein KAH48_09580 [Chlorobi bacterium]|nr:hypothetical protein [Chlorobiota bacterium]
MVYILFSGVRMIVRRKSIGLLSILVLFISSCASIDTTVKIEPGFVGQKYKNVCVMANYDIAIMKYDTEKFFCDELKKRSVRAVRGQELFDDPKYYLEDDSTITVLKENKIDACVVITRKIVNLIDGSIGYISYSKKNGLEFYFPDDYLYQVDYTVSVVDISTGKSEWSSLSKTESKGQDDKNLGRTIKIIAKDICKRLQRDNVIGR